MKRFVAIMNDGSFINLPATRMEMDKDSNAIIVFDGNELVAYMDTSAVITAHIGERKEQGDGNVF